MWKPRILFSGISLTINGMGQLLSAGYFILMLYAWPAAFCILLWESSKSYYVDSSGLQIRRLIGSRRIKWSEVSDFAVETASPPHRPNKLVLWGSKGKLCTVRLKVTSPDILRKALITHCPLMEEGSLDSVRHPPAEPGPSFRHLMWWNVFGLFMWGLVGAFTVFMFMILGLPPARECVNYYCIRANPIIVSGSITDIDTSEGQLTVDYTSADGSHHTMTRGVSNVIATNYQAGDPILVEHLAGHPEIARLQSAEFEGPMWISILAFFPIAALLGYSGWTSLKTILRPLHATWKWRVRETDGTWIANLSGTSLQSLAATIPKRHRVGGAILFQSSNMNADSTLNQWERLLNREGFETRCILDRFLCVDGRCWRTILQRLDRKGYPQINYIVTSEEGIDDVERWIWHNLPASLTCDAIAEYTPVAPFFFIERLFGPFNRRELRDFFNAWTRHQIATNLRKLAPPDIHETDFWRLLNLDIEDGEHEFLCERYARSIRLWVRRGKTKRAMRVEWREGRCQLTPDLPLPSEMRFHWLAYSIGAVFLSPCLLLASPVLLMGLVIWPVSRWEASRLEKNFAKARQQALESMALPDSTDAASQSSVNDGA